MTRVLVNLLYFSGSRGGMETYAREIYSRLTAEPDVEWIGLASRELIADGGEWFPGRLIDSGISALSRPSWALGELFQVSRVARRVQADVIHSIANFGPLRSRVPIVLTIHDLLAFRHPEWVLTRAVGWFMRWMTRGAARAARAILTISAASARDVHEILGIPDDRIIVVPLGAAPVELSGHVAEQRMVFAPGNRMPHKNLDVLFSALATLPPSERPHLEVTGGRPGDPLTRLAEELGIAEYVTIHGWLTQVELEDAYARAAIVALPTRFEGFGLPVLEAMTRGKPIVCSDLPVLREVGGDAAVYVSPDDPDGFAAAILALLDDAAEREDLAAKGRAHAAWFSWDRTAAATRDVVVRVGRSGS